MPSVGIGNGEWDNLWGAAGVPIEFKWLAKYMLMDLELERNHLDR